MNQLADLKNNSSDESEQSSMRPPKTKSHEHQLKALDKEIKRKTKNERYQIKQLNEQLLTFLKYVKNLMRLPL